MTALPKDSEKDEWSDDMYCRFCDQLIRVTLLNNFLTHLTEVHQLKISHVVMGSRTVVHLENGVEINIT